MTFMQFAVQINFIALPAPWAERLHNFSRLDKFGTHPQFFVLYYAIAFN